ncbi:MAG: 50S ribosomal protein L29 [candidate division Zixibacteria bacterium]|jgi:large subunit ribosomal protein L29|nr:50S ribosomal protein L29 [candidate division Zixibacteria bacterium]
MKAREIRNLTIEEIQIKKAEVEKELFNLKVRQATRQIDNPLKVRVLRRDLARINSILREDELNIRKLAGKGQAADEK